MKRTHFVMAFAALVCFLIGPDAAAQNIGPSGGLQVEGITGAAAVPMSASSLPLPSGAAQETGGNLATMASAVQTPGSAAPARAFYMGCGDGTNARAMACNAAGQPSMNVMNTVTMVLGTPSRHDLGPTLASGATQLSSGVGVFLGSSASTAALGGANLCFYDGNPSSGGVLIGAYNVPVNLMGTYTIPPQGVPYTNGLWVRAGSVLVSCVSLGTSLALGYGWALTSP